MPIKTVLSGEGRSGAPALDRENPVLEGTEGQFVTQLRIGDERSFEQLVRTYGPSLLKTAERILRDPSEAQDCVQEAFIRVHRKIDDFRGDASLKTWLHRIVVNGSLMKVRARQSRPTESIDHLLPTFNADGCRLEPLGTDAEAPERVAIDADICRKVSDAIDALPESYRVPLILRDIEGYSTKEVAETLSLSQSNVKVRVHRARAALKTLLEPMLLGGEQ